MMTIDEIMTSEPVTLGTDASLDQAGVLMLKHRIRHIPIVDSGNHLLGLITQRDLLHAVSNGQSEAVVGDVMRKQLYKITRETDMRGAGLLMQQHKIGSLPVMEDDELVGIVTDTDYVSLAINLLEQIDETEPFEDDDFDAEDDVAAFEVDDESYN